MSALPLRHPDQFISGAEAPLRGVIGRTPGSHRWARGAATAWQWVRERLRALGVADLGTVEGLLASDSSLTRAERWLLSKRIPEGTHFFRDAGQCDLLAGTLLPELVARRASSKRLRLWIAGCSTGEEAYTLAILVDELGPAVADWNIQIMASDINPGALEGARRGVYDAWSCRSMDAGRRARYLQQFDSLWRIDARLQDRIEFRAVDLVREPFPDEAAGLNEFDLILCPNSFAFLSEAAMGAVSRKFAAAMAVGGYLVTDHGDLFAHDPAPLRLRRYPRSAAYEKVATPVRAATEKSNAASPHRTEREAATCHTAIVSAALAARPHFLLSQRPAAAEAKTLLRKAADLSPAFIASYLELAVLHAQEGDHQTARRFFRAVRTALVLLPAAAGTTPHVAEAAGEVLSYVDQMLGQEAH